MRSLYFFLYTLVIAASYSIATYSVRAASVASLATFILRIVSAYTGPPIFTTWRLAFLQELYTA